MILILQLEQMNSMLKSKNVEKSKISEKKIDRLIDNFMVVSANHDRLNNLKGLYLY